jgi:hypothetical protein
MRANPTNFPIFFFCLINLLKITVHLSVKKVPWVGCQWHTPVILVTQEAEIRRIVVQSQHGQAVRETLSQKHPSQKKGWQSGLM